MVIPTYTISRELENTALIAIASYSDQVDELIVTEDGGMFSPEIMRSVDHYLYNQKNVGYTANVNRGWRLATGDFTAIVNSDTTLRKGKLIDLCLPGKVTSPVTRSENVVAMWGAFFVVPREIKEKYGMLREEMKMYCSDSEYEARIFEHFQKVDGVEVLHELGKTCHASGVFYGETQERDQEEYSKLVERGEAKRLNL